jgi:hypothetical protein
MKKFITFIKEDATQPAKPLENPSLLFNDPNAAMDAAKQQAASLTAPQDRVYVIKYKYYRQNNTKPYVVIHNKQLVDSEPNWEAKGYNITAWVSPLDGVVTKTQDGRFAKEQQ